MRLLPDTWKSEKPLRNVSAVWRKWPEGEEYPLLQKPALVIFRYGDGGIYGDQLDGNDIMPLRR